MKLDAQANGRGYCNGDKITLEVDFGADTLAIYRNKGTSTEGKHVKHGIPFKEVYFVAGPYNSNCTCSILADEVRLRCTRLLSTNLAARCWSDRVDHPPPALLLRRGPN